MLKALCSGRILVFGLSAMAGSFAGVVHISPTFISSTVVIIGLVIRFLVGESDDTTMIDAKYL
jgi:hypothetical protein